MNKNQIGYALLLFSLGFTSCFFLFYSDKKERGQPLNTDIQHERIDTLELTIVKIDSSISKVRKTKLKNKKKYEEDIVAISNLEYDSLYRIFSKAYPREEYK